MALRGHVGFWEEGLRLFLLVIDQVGKGSVMANRRGGMLSCNWKSRVRQFTERK